MTRFEKIKGRLPSERLHRGFDTMVRLYCKDMTKSEKNTFADFLVKQMNSGYRVALYERSFKYRFKLLKSKIKNFFSYHYQANF